MSADEYERQYAEEKSRNCSRHVDAMITLACLVCLQTFCMTCLSDLGQCENGQSVCLCIEAAGHIRSDTECSVYYR
mgnify:CR=1 FL=1